MEGTLRYQKFPKGLVWGIGRELRRARQARD